LIVSAFDRSTRMFPFIDFDQRMIPCGPRSIGAALLDAGMTKTRFVYQLWNPNIDPSLAKIDGEPIDMLLVSAMQVHSAASYRLVEQAWQAGDHRPLIIAGGPKACYEPFDYFGLGRDGQIGADVVVTGEEPVLLELLITLAGFGGGPGQMREAFVRAKRSGALANIPGLVYSLDDRYDGMNLTNTGIQRLMTDLDDLPLTSVGYRILEPPHRRKTLSPTPMPIHKLGGKGMVTTILMTRGCKYNCHYCPIPAYNQHSYRRKTPQRVAEEFADCYHQIGTYYIFGADDNFFNNRKYAEETIQALASTQLDGKALGWRLRFGTECTVADAYKLRDIFPIAKRGGAGLSGLWMGVEDLSAQLVDKGQGYEITKNLFAEMWRNDISPMVMMMHSEDQPVHAPDGLSGFADQLKFLFRAGAVGAQCTVVNPAIGSRWMNDAYKQHLLFNRVGGQKIPDAYFDGNHVLATYRPDAWRVQMGYFRGYAAFYNPINFIRACFDKNTYLRTKRLFYQLWGMATFVRTLWKLKGYFWRLRRGKIERAQDWPEKFRRQGSPYPGLINPAQTSTTISTEEPAEI
jgi:radical SAM superfamily enzyme YgiQ (UPF0313 family)